MLIFYQVPAQVPAFSTRHPRYDKQPEVSVNVAGSAGYERNLGDFFVFS